MICLLDTHTFIWTIQNTDKLSKKCKEIISAKTNEICVSTVSFWEISLKTGIKKFFFENLNIRELPRFAGDMDFSIIGLNAQEAATFHELPQKENHKDPFDRMLVWQAICRNMTILSKDEFFEQYKEDGLKLIW